jgi:uncharacterized phage-associated protein
MATALDVAKYILLIADDDDGDLISNLKLQKLLYYCQGFALVLIGRPIFDAKIKAWEHGPVVPEVWFEFKKHGQLSIPPPSQFDMDVLSVKDRNLINEVYNVYGQYSAWKLRNMTHSEPPWTQTAKDSVISHDKLISYFKTQVTDDERDTETKKRKARKNS